MILRLTVRLQITSSCIKQESEQFLNRTHCQRRCSLLNAVKSESVKSGILQQSGKST